MSYFSQDVVLTPFCILQTPWTKLTRGPDLQPLWRAGAPLGFGDVWEISAIRQSIPLSKGSKAPRSFAQETFQLLSKERSVGRMINFMGRVKGELFCLLLATLWHPAVQKLQIVQTNASCHWKVKVFPFRNWVPPLRRLCASLMDNSRNLSHSPQTLTHSHLLQLTSAPVMFLTHSLSHFIFLFICFSNYLTRFLLFFEESTIARSLPESSKRPKSLFV